MGHRRNRSNSSANVGVQQQRIRQQAAEPSNGVILVDSSPPESQPGMTPASRYNHNLKVLRRREPSIVSIFDQFSHVCVYHHNGKKWEKHGFEGSMFLYERESYPPYGFYILNRMGMDDYVQRLYPEDDIGAHGNYLMLRSYPEFTVRRLAAARLRHPDLPDKFSNAYAISDLEKVKVQEKGKSSTIGLWMFATDAREPMIDVMTRLHSYIKMNIPYPEEYRYGPDRPPPPNPHLQTSSTPLNQGNVLGNGNGPSPDAERSLSTTMKQHSGNDRFSANHPSQAYANGGVSELDKLFSRIGTSSSTTSSPSAPVSDPTSTMATRSLFATSGGSGISSLAPTSSQASATASNRGLALLNSIFASATPSPPILAVSDGKSRIGFPSSSSAPSLLAGKSLTSAMPPTSIISPQPTSTSLPQVLNQDVISTLLGMTPTQSPESRSSSAATSSSSSRNRYEGDNEGGSDGGFSESSAVLEAEMEANGELQAAGSRVGLPLLSVPTQAEFGMPGNGVIHGDVTPRPLLRPELRGSKSSSPPLSEHSPVRIRARNPTPFSSSMRQETPPPILQSTMTVVATSSDSVAKPARSLVPFEAESTLWPYPRPPLDDRSMDNEEDIVELDFADTSALSDPAAFNSRVQQEKSKSRKNVKKGKKERAEERKLEREAIENSWDVPVPASTLACTSTSALSSTLPVQAKHNVINGSNTAIDKDVVQEAIATAAAAQTTRKHEGLERNEFVREVLTLIHMDKAFVDRLYLDYLSRME